MVSVSRCLLILFVSLFVLHLNSCKSPDLADADRASSTERSLSGEELEQLLSAGRTALAAARFDDAVRALSEGLGAAPNDPRFNFETGACYLAMGEKFAAEPELGGDPGAAFHDSETYFRKTLELDPLHERAEFLLARALFSNSRLIEARAAIEAYLDRFPRDAAARLLAGRILLASHTARITEPADGESAGDCVEEAIGHLSHAIELDPSEPAGHITLGDCSLHKGDVETALSAYQKGIVRCMESSDLHQRLVTCFRGSDLFSPVDAIEFYTSLLSVERLTPEAKGMLCWFQGVWYDALGRGEYEIERYDSAAEAYARCAECYNRCGQIHSPFAAEALYEEAQAFSNVGWAHYYGGSYDRAEQNFCKALALRQDLTNAILGIDYLGAALTNRDGLVEGRNFFRRAATTHPWNSKWWNNYALFARETGQNEQAYTGYVKAMTLAPDDTRYINDCGMMLLYYLDRQPAEAEKLFRTAWITGEEKCADPFISKEDHKYHFDAYCDAMLNLGRLLLIQNRIDECAPIAESLAQKAPQRPDVQELLTGLERTRRGIPYELPE